MRYVMLVMLSLVLVGVVGHRLGMVSWGEEPAVADASAGADTTWIDRLDRQSQGIAGGAGEPARGSGGDAGRGGAGAAAARAVGAGVEPTHEVTRVVEPEVLTAAEVFARAQPAVGVVSAYERGVLVRQGTGFVVTADGLIVTNHHVVAEGTGFRFQLDEGLPELALGSPVALDERADLAVFDAPGQGWATLAVAPSASGAVGDRVYALGNPLGLTGTFSEGMVSARRTMDGVRVLQTTAPISPGSSGGPLLDGFGRVVGVNTFQFADGQNLNFAISVSHLLSLLAGQVTPGGVDGGGAAGAALALDGVMGGSSPVAIINGELLRVGETVRGETVVAIDTAGRRCELRAADGTTRWLELKAASPRPVTSDPVGEDAPAAPPLTVIGFTVQTTDEGGRLTLRVHNPTARSQYLSRLTLEGYRPGFVNQFVPAGETVEVTSPITRRPAWVELDCRGVRGRFRLEEAGAGR